MDNDINYYLLLNKPLDKKFLDTLEQQGNKTIYANRTTIDPDELRQNNINFKQLPYDLEGYPDV